MRFSYSCKPLEILICFSILFLAAPAHSEPEFAEPKFGGEKEFARGRITPQLLSGDRVSPVPLSLEDGSLEVGGEESSIKEEDIPVIGGREGDIGYGAILNRDQLAKDEIQSERPLDILGRSEQELRARFGDPDRVIENSSSSHMWYFDKAVVFFTDQKVVAWTNEEDLKAREFGIVSSQMLPVAAIASSRKKEKSWINAWTPPVKEINRQRILSEVVEGLL